MPHIIILGEAIEALEAKMSTPPSEAQINLMNALQAADAYAHSANPDEEILAAIEELAGSIKGYLDAYETPSDIRLQSYANQMNAIVP